MQQLEEFVQRQLGLVSMERQEEMAAEAELLKSSARTLQDKGLALHKVYLAARSTGLYGRRVLELETYQRAKDLPSHSICAGDIVGVFHSQQQQQQLVSGIVTKVLARAVFVAVEPDQDGGVSDSALEIGCRYSVVKLGSDVTYKRLKKGLLALLQKPPPLADLLLGERSLAPARDLSSLSQACAGIVFFNPNLDDSQRAAVELGMRRSDLVMIHGPPGTGKTTTLVELARQLVARGERLLCCAPSNTAVDNLTERLFAAGIRCVRLGHPARQLPQVAEHSLDALLARSEDRRIINDVRADIDKLLSGAGGGRGHRRDRRIGTELSSLRSELRQREANCVRAILARAQAVLCTLTVGGLNDDSTLKEIAFDATIIDECSQATEAACWLALPRASKCILAGDPYQLPPTVKSERAVAGGFAVTLMERLLPIAAEATHLLTVQYRMHADIMRWSSNAFYSDKLTAHQSVAGHRLTDLPGFAAAPAVENEEEEDEFPPLLLIDTTGCDLAELETEDSEMSKANPGEAVIVAEHVSALVDSGLDPSDIAVISPYNLQVENIRLALQQSTAAKPEAAAAAGAASPLHRVEVRSVDGFQGREKEAVVMSLVRSNRKGVVGFLAEHRRLNVAVTRARRHLCVIADCETVRRGDSVLAGFVDYLLANARVRSANEYAHVLDDIVIPSQGDSSGAKHQQKQQSKRGGQNKQQKIDREAKEARLQQLLDVVRLLAKSSRSMNSMATLSESASAVGAAVVFAAADSASTNEGEEAMRQFELRFVGLNPYERARLHEECEQLGLQHRSIDDDSDSASGGRVLLVSLSSTSKTATVSATATDSPLATATDSPLATATAVSVDSSLATATAMSTDSATANQPNQASATATDLPLGSATATNSAGESAKSGPNLAKPSKAAKRAVQTPTTVVRDAAEDVDDAVQAPKCQVCGKPVPLGNADLHRIACERAARNRQLRAAVEGATAAADCSAAAAGGQKTKKSGGIALGVGPSTQGPDAAAAAADAKKSKQASKAKKSTGASAAKSDPKGEENEDFDALLAEFVAMDSTCGYTGCSVPVRTVGHACNHCRRRYCFSHFVPETHGCGQAAREAARSGARLSTASPAMPKSSKDAIRRVHLQRKLESRLDDMEQARRPAEVQQQQQQQKKKNKK